MLSKLLAQSDLMTVSKIINRPDLIGRLKVLMGRRCRADLDSQTIWAINGFRGKRETAPSA